MPRGIELFSGKAQEMTVLCQKKLSGAAVRYGSTKYVKF